MKFKMLFAPLCLAVMSQAHAQAWTYVEPYNSVCQAAYPCQIGAVHTLRIVNDTPVPQTYNWFMSVKADNGDVVNIFDTITLQPGQELRKDKIKNIGYMKFNMKGRKMLHCTTQIDGYEHATARKDGYADVS